ncbi:hypothetical protein VNO80_19339 [Phaseolus coccineus]|uniref:Uncharacterized protein n=1 Tax=Phaseolus coccineus TaxID=3886 RepID=A0AAN9R060_PHACN
MKKSRWLRWELSLGIKYLDVIDGEKEGLVFRRVLLMATTTVHGALQASIDAANDNTIFLELLVNNDINTYNSDGHWLESFHSPSLYIELF